MFIEASLNSNAKECSAVRHCIQTVWEKQRLPEDNDDICTICKNMVQEARDQLLSNETQVIPLVLYWVELVINSMVLVTNI